MARRLARSPRTPHESEGLLRYYHQCVWPGYQSQAVPALERLLALWYVLAACIGASLILSATGDLDSAFVSFEYMASQDNTTGAQVCSSRRTATG